MSLPTGPLFTLAQSRYSIVQMIVALGLVLVVTAVLLATLSVVRRRMRDDAAAAAGVGRGFTLNDLRTLHRQGKLSDEEFERAKSKLVSNVQSTLAKEKKPSLVEKPLGEELKDA